MKTTDSRGAAERQRHAATAGATDFLSETHLESQEHGRVALRALAGKCPASAREDFERLKQDISPEVRALAARLEASKK